MNYTKNGLSPVRIAKLGLASVCLSLVGVFTFALFSNVIALANAQPTAVQTPDNELTSYFERTNSSVTVQDTPFVTANSVLGAKQANHVRDLARAQFITAFKHSSGIKVNIYQSKLGDTKQLIVGEDAIAAVMSYVLNYSETKNNGFATAQELAHLTALAGKGDLDTVTLDIVVATDVCNDELIPSGGVSSAVWKSDPACNTAGTYFPVGKAALDQPSQHVITLSMFQGVDEDSQVVERRMIKHLAHEFAHLVAELSGAHERVGSEFAQLADQKHQDVLNSFAEREHTEFVEPIVDGLQPLLQAKSLPFPNVPLRVIEQ